MTVVQIERHKVEFLVPVNIPVPEYRIGQLVEVETTGYYLAPNELRWFPARITGMAYATDNRPVPEWEYQLKFLNSGSDVDEWFSEDELWLLEDY